MLKTLFEIKGSIEGKLALQKTFYFVKEFGLYVPFTFRWGKLGPFSYELSNAMSRVSSRGFAPYNGTYQYNERFFRHVEVLEIPPNIPQFFYDIETICENNGFNIVYFYEALSSVHFLFKYSELVKRRDIFNRLHDLKPNRMKILDPLLLHAWDFLQEHGLLEKPSRGVPFEF